MFQITSAEDVNKLLRKHNYDILIDLAKSCDDDEYGKAVLNRLMKDLMNTKVGELLRELLKKGASLEARAKPGPKPGAKRKASPAPAPTSPGRKSKAAVVEPVESKPATEEGGESQSQKEVEEEEARAFDTPPKKKRG